MTEKYDEATYQEHLARTFDFKWTVDSEQCGNGFYEPLDVTHVVAVLVVKDGGQGCVRTYSSNSNTITEIQTKEGSKAEYELLTLQPEHKAEVIGKPAFRLVKRSL